MLNSRWLGLLLLAGSAMPLIGCHAPVVNLHNIDVEEMSMSKVALALEFKIENPNWCALPLTGLEYDFRYQGKVFAKGKLPPPVPMVGGGETVTLRAPLGLSGDKFMPLVRKCWGGTPVKYNIHVLATFGVLGIPLPVTLDKASTLPAIELPQWSLSGTKIKRTPEPTLVLSFELTNPNSHAMSLASVSGKLKAGREVIMEIHQPSVVKISGKNKAHVEIPIMLNTTKLFWAVTNALINRQALIFDGDFNLAKPLELK